MHEGASPRISAKRGFSLVELVVALGVGLSILALVFPALSEARTLAVRSVTQSNLRQIGVATHAYAQARSGALPDSLPAEVGRYAWLNLVRLPRDPDLGDARWDGFGQLFANGTRTRAKFFTPRPSRVSPLGRTMSPTDGQHHVRTNPKRWPARMTIAVICDGKPSPRPGAGSDALTIGIWFWPPTPSAVRTLGETVDSASYVVMRRSFGAIVPCLRHKLACWRRMIPSLPSGVPSSTPPTEPA